MRSRVPIKYLFDVSRDMVMPTDFGSEPLFHYSLPAWHEHGDGEVENAADLASGKLLLNGGEVLVSKLNPEKSAVLVAKSHEIPTVCSPEFIALIPRKIDTRFSYYAMLAAPVRHQLNASVESVTNSHKRARVDRFLASPLEIPDLPTQRAIADFLDRETARIDLLIEKKQRLLDMVSPRFEALIHAARSEGAWRRFGFCVKSTTRPIPNISDQSFVPLGLYNRGRGFFKKSDTDFDELGDSSFFFVEEGDLVFSGQFAWEGAVGLVSERESGCVVSHRYPVYVGTEGVISEYLYAYFRSHHGRFLMDNCSRGAAGRNRPLNTRILEKEKIPVPPLSLQDEVKHIVLFERRLKGKITPSIDRLREYRSALITAAVTGQISVSEWSKSGEVDRQLDSLGDKVSA